MYITIVVTVFNKSREHLAQCLKSLLAQTLRPDEYEIILVDDCSTEMETIAAVNDFEYRESRIRVIRHPENLGPNDARKTGARAAVGDYIVFVDGDDFLTTDAIESLRIQALRTNADIVISNFFRFNEVTHSYDKWDLQGKALPTDYHERLRIILSGKSSFTMCGRLIRKSLLDELVFAMPRNLLHEDIITLSRIMFNVRSVVSVNRCLYFYRWNPSSITSKVTARHVAGICFAFADWIEQAKQRNLLDNLSSAISQGMATLLDTIVKRAVYSAEGNVRESVALLNNLWQRIQSLAVRPPDGDNRAGIRFLCAFQNENWSDSPEVFMQLSRQHGLLERPSYYDSQAVLPEGLRPSEVASRLKDRVVIICQVDYHFRNAAAFAKQLALRGYPCVVVDNSAFAAGGKRPVSADDRRLLWRTTYLRIDRPPYGSDWLSTARLVITFNDFNDDFREALEYRSLLGQRSVCMIEGINDFLRIDFNEPRYLPYRRCDTVFLAGQDDAQYFEDRSTFVIGLPVIEALARKQPQFPSRPRAVLNVNFTYGALEECRSAFVAAASRAFENAGWDWVITQHPMDNGQLGDLPVSEQSQYELIDCCTVFVSRFATGILEALASGKPVIYFNPHGEKVEKFKGPMGAFDIATTEIELVQALNKVRSDVVAGVDFRARALPFLIHHTGYAPGGPTAAERFADAVVNIVESDLAPNRRVAQLFFERLEARDRFRRDVPGVVFGDLDRRHYGQLEETDVVARYFGQRGRIMIDVGANIGQSADVFLGRGWTVHAFEPDPANRKRLEELSPYYPCLHINAQAVSDTGGQKLAFFASEESTGISSLSAFTAGHKPICEVETIALAEYCRLKHIAHVDFLKVDVEGHDKFVLDGFDWAADQPDVVLCEFEDAKTLQNGYSAHDLASSLVARGYSVYVSEWLPIERYGLAHDWRRLIRYAPDIDVSGSWGNLIAFVEDPGECQLRELVLQSIKFAPKPAHRTSAVAAEIVPKKGDGDSVKVSGELGQLPVSARNAIWSSVGKATFRVHVCPDYSQIAPNQWRYTHSEAKQRLWVAVFDQPVVAGEEFIGALRIQADHAMSVNVTLARHDIGDYEGTSQRTKLIPGVPQTFKLVRQFNSAHSALKLQVEVVELPGGGSAELTIEDLCIVGSQLALQRRLRESSITVGEANQLFRDGDFSGAMQMYLLLYEQRPLQMYADNAFRAARRMGCRDVKSIDDLRLKQWQGSLSTDGQA